ncbi:MAG: hypothetical protein FJY67_01130 [Calditrichaeota bacterium]|nr:hypothetical protein [Calditrichota bacterium]
MTSLKLKVLRIVLLCAVMGVGLSSLVLAEPSNMFPRTDDPELWGFYIVDSPTLPRRDDPDRVGFLFGWPRQMSAETPAWGRTPTLLDIDANGDLEVGAMSGDLKLHIYQHDGAYYPGFPTRQHFGGRPQAWVNPNHPITTAVGEFDGNGRLDQGWCADIGFLHITGESGDEPHPYPLDLGRNLRFGLPGMIDLEGNNRVEVVFHRYHASLDSQRALLDVVNDEGTSLEGWPVAYEGGSNSSPAVGDIDGDGRMDIVIGSRRSGNALGGVWAFRQDGVRLGGFPVRRYETIGGPIALADLDRDGRLEIILWAQLADSTRGGIFAFNYRGEVAEGFPAITRSGHPTGSVAIADMDGDRSPEIAFGTFDPERGAQIYVWNAGGRLLNGYPVTLGGPAVVGSVILADVSGDRLADVIAAVAPTEGGQGHIAAFDMHGRPVEGFPISLVEWGGGALAGTPTVGDLNRDGSNDLMAVTISGRLLAWNTPGAPAADEWPTERGSMARLGLRPADFPRAVGSEGRSTLPTRSSLKVAPNPFNGFATISLTLTRPEEAGLRIYDVSGRLCSRLDYGRLASGVHRLTLDVRQTGLTPGIYYLRWGQGSAPLTETLLYLP